MLIDDAFSSLTDIAGAYGTSPNPSEVATPTSNDTTFGSVISSIFSAATSLGGQYLKTEAAQAQAKTTAATTTSSWLIFAAIGGGVLLLIIVLFFAVRR